MNKQFNSIRYAGDFTLGGNDTVRMTQVLKLAGEGKKILDVGCGDGFCMELFKQAGNQVEGIEIAENAIKKARKKGFQVYDISLVEKNWAKEITEKFDIVFAGEIIEHVFDTDLFLKNISAVLKKKGEVIITTPNIASLGRRLLLLLGKNPLIETTARKHDAGHIRYFTQDTLIKLLEENNFEIIDVKSTVINLHLHGKFFSEKLARIFPTFGNNIIIKARKN